jgi:hypothetical protein
MTLLRTMGAIATFVKQSVCYEAPILLCFVANRLLLHSAYGLTHRNDESTYLKIHIIYHGTSKYFYFAYKILHLQFLSYIKNNYF